jgi:hypothetical protein
MKNITKIIVIYTISVSNFVESSIRFYFVSNRSLS